MELTILSYHPNCSRILGYKENQLLGHYIWVIMHFIDREHYMKMCKIIQLKHMKQQLKI